MSAIPAISSPPPAIFQLLLQTKHFFNSTLAWPLRHAWVALGPPLGHPGLIYLTQWYASRQNISAVTGLFALLSLLSTQGHAISGNGTGQRVNADPPLTKAPDERRQWLRERVSKSSRTSASRNSLWQKARSLPKSSWQSHPITTSSKLFSRIRLLSVSTWSRVSKLCLSWLAGSLAATGLSNAGDLFSANNFVQHQTRPASLRVFLFGLASRSSPEEYGGEQLAVCGGAL